MAEPLCPYFGTCGGCSLQHLDYSSQLNNKKKLLAKLIGFEDIEVVNDNPYHYRNRMDFIFSPAGLGFRKKKDYKFIVPIEKCVISNEELNKLLSEVRSFFKGADYFDIVKKSGTFRYAVIRTPFGDSSISFVLNEDSSRINDATSKIEEFAKITSAKNIVVAYVPSNSDISISENYFVVKGNEFLKTTLYGKEFFFHSQGFFQNNSNMNEKMQEYCNKILSSYNKNNELKNKYLLDLYGGVGTFGIINSHLFKRTTIVEKEENTIKVAKQNIEHNKLANVEAIAMEDRKIVKLNLKQPLFVIADPPRSGMHIKTISHLKEISPEVIIYISCNPEQLGKDVKKFKDYSITKATMFDLFPQTQHMESIVVLERKREQKE